MQTRRDQSEQIALRSTGRNHPMVEARIKAMKCCAQVHPNGTSKWRYCKNEAIAHNPDTRRVYCERHIDQA